MKRYLLAGCRNVKLLLILYRCYSESAAEPGFACFIRQMVRAGVPLSIIVSIIANKRSYLQPLHMPSSPYHQGMRKLICHNDKSLKLVYLLDVFLHNCSWSQSGERRGSGLALLNQCQSATDLRLRLLYLYL